MKGKALGSLVVMGFMFFLEVAHAEGQLAPNPVPQISQPVVPMSLAPGGGDFVLTVNGTGFVPDSVVNWNGDPRPTNFISSRQLSADIPASDIATGDTAWVTVVNPAPGGGTSNVAFFHVTNPGSSVVLRRIDITGDMVSSIDGGVSPPSVISHDFNRDKRLDLAIITARDGAVSIMLGNGNGTFQPAVPYPTGFRPFSVTAADFNRDGKVDLAVGIPGGVSILLGNGDGTFQAHLDYGPGNGQVVTADFNADGYLDLVTNRLRNLSVLMGNGDGTFQPGVSFPVAFGPNSPTTGDFNADGRLDLAATHFLIDTVSVLPGSGDGTLGPAASYVTGAGPISLIAIDINGDGNLDLATANQNCEGGLCRDGPPSTFSILLGKRDGSFQTTGYTWWGPARGLASGDFDGDGKPDLAGITDASTGVRVLIALGNGDGTLQPPLYFEASPGALSMAPGDFNGDGRLDLVTANYGSLDTVSIFLQAAALLEVGIDIKPGDPKNTINLKSAGTLPVAILGSATFDPLTVDPAKVTLAGAHVATRGRGQPMTASMDANRDGYPDLLLHFRTQDLRLTRTSTEAVLYGETYSGQRLRGSDAVRIVPIGGFARFARWTEGPRGRRVMPAD